MWVKGLLLVSSQCIFIIVIYFLKVKCVYKKELNQKEIALNFITSTNKKVIYDYTYKL